MTHKYSDEEVLDMIESFVTDKNQNDEIDILEHIQYLVNKRYEVEL